MIMTGGLSGCGELWPAHVDCKVVKLQADSGRDDAEIASALDTNVDQIASCRSLQNSANKTADIRTPNNIADVWAPDR